MLYEDLASLQGDQNNNDINKIGFMTNLLLMNVRNLL